MNRVIFTIGLLVFVSLFTGCTGHLVRIKSERLTPGKEGLKPGSRIHVVEKNNLFMPGKGVFMKGEIMRYLVSRGFAEGDSANADYYLALGYTLHDGRLIREDVQVMVNYSGFSDTGGNPALAPPPTVQPLNPAPMGMGKVRNAFEVSVSARLMDGEGYRNTHEMKEIWTCKARAYVDYPDVFEKTVPLMIPAVLENLGENVEKEIIVWEKGKKGGF
jgi:hypothetical protein